MNKNKIISFKIFLTLFIILITFIVSLIFDKQIFLFLRNYNIYIWYLFDIFFSSKFWLLYVFIFGVYFFIKYIQDIKIYFSDFKNTDNKKKFLFNLIYKTRKSKFFIIIYSLLISIILTLLLKYLIGRQRPVFFEALNISGFYPFKFDWAFNSMPSGHTSSSFSVLFVLSFFYKKLIIFILLAILIGISRVCFGAHFPSDIILGAFIGVLSSFTSYNYIYKNNKK